MVLSGVSPLLFSSALSVKELGVLSVGFSLGSWLVFISASAGGGLYGCRGTRLVACGVAAVIGESGDILGSVAPLFVPLGVMIIT